MRLSGVVLAVVAALACAPVAANPLSRILSKSGFTPEDTNLMRETEQRILGAAQPGSLGAVSWKNADSGAHGEVRFGARQGNCMTLVHQAYLEGSDEPRQLSRKFCEAEAGWLLSQ
ncbi:hypothetical protein KUV61_16640 [Nocardioides marinus]|uniref:hypothetical protein n=1 Tax=Leisingera sp. TaxID=1879318 RepID=UPI001C985B17|nr:hypothetical protein [Nocardioides marinus]